MTRSTPPGEEEMRGSSSTSLPAHVAPQGSATATEAQGSAGGEEGPTPGRILHRVIQVEHFKPNGWVTEPFAWDDYDEAGHAEWEEMARRFLLLSSEAPPVSPSEASAGTPATDELLSQLNATTAKLEEVTRERDELRLAICGGEDAPGHNASLSHETILGVLRENYAAWRDATIGWVRAQADNERLKAEVRETNSLARRAILALARVRGALEESVQRAAILRTESVYVPAPMACGFIATAKELQAEDEAHALLSTLEPAPEGGEGHDR